MEVAGDVESPERPPGGGGNRLREPREEPGLEEILTSREAHPERLVTPHPTAVEERRADERNVGLPPVGDGENRSGAHAEPLGAERAHVEGGLAVDPHAGRDGVVEESHLADSMGDVPRLSLGDPAPAFTLPGVDGADHGLDDYEAMPAAVVFSCCHCPYVHAWEDRLNDVARD